MTKFLFFSDIHVDATVAGNACYDVVNDFMAGVFNDISVAPPDVVVFCGDAYDPGTLDELRWQSTLLRWVGRFGTIPQIWIAGNHDTVGKSHMGQPVTVLSPMREAFWHLPTHHVVELPRVIDLGDTLLLALPHVATGFVAGANACLDELLPGLRKRGKKKLVVAAHLSFDGMVPGSEAEMARGKDSMFPLEKIAELKPDLVVNGHYHRREVITRGGIDIHIVGSPMPFTFGDPVDARGYMIAEV